MVVPSEFVQVPLAFKFVWTWCKWYLHDWKVGDMASAKGTHILQISYRKPTIIRELPVLYELLLVNDLTSPPNL